MQELQFNNTLPCHMCKEALADRNVLLGETAFCKGAAVRAKASSCQQSCPEAF